MTDSMEEERKISSLHTAPDNDLLTNGIEEKLINLDDDDTEFINNDQNFENSQNNQNHVKNQNCHVLESELQKKDASTFSNSETFSETKVSKVIKREKKSGNASSFSVESKIAQEIKEMKQREEDLRKMREMLAKEMSLKSTDATPVPMPVNNIKPEAEKRQVPTLKPEQEKTKSKTQIVNGTQSYNMACVFGHKRKDASSLKDSPQKTDKKQSATSVYESPIEREIRIVRQREEELKREREQALKIKMQLESCQQNPDLSDDEKDTTLDTFASVSLCSDSSFDSGTKLTSEQGHFDETLSPVTMNNKINAMYCNSSNAGSICSLDSISQNEKSNNFNGFAKTYSQNTTSKDYSPHNNSIRSPSPDSSSNSSISKLTFPFNAQKHGALVQNKNVNMERFIASKGKQIVFKNTSPINAVGCPDYLEIKPPQIKKSDQLSQRKFVSAASKIQSELQEMKEREEELKKERARLLGLKGQLSDLTPETKDFNQNENISTDICSSPDFLENEKDISIESEKEESMVNHTRRRSTLIEEWERRIQKLGVEV